jgi:hypothetical protein
MKLMILIGNSAVGKMSVGQELARITPLRLFHNHMMIEPVLEIFGSFRGDVIQKLRSVIFEEFAKSDLYGMIFTFMWAFDMPSDWEYLESLKAVFGLPEEDVYYVELIAPQEVRLARNCTENRLKNKASKRDVTASNARLIRDDENYRCESLPGEITWPNYLRIDNSHLSPADTAKLIQTHFGFPDA